jgi:hypothetical protein
VHSLEDKFTSNSHSQYNTKVDVEYYSPAAGTTLNSPRLSCVHPRIDRALLSLLQTHP